MIDRKQKKNYSLDIQARQFFFSVLIILLRSILCFMFAPLTAKKQKKKNGLAIYML